MPKASSEKTKPTTMSRFFGFGFRTDKKARKKNFFKWGDRDTEQYRYGYPGKKDNPKAKKNIGFYSNTIKSYPDGDFIDNIHKEWYGKYKLLESHHGYIQWLFPIRESGMNFYSQELQLHEAEEIKRNKDATCRVLKSYKLMLDFYGLELEDEQTGKLKRSSNYKERFDNLNRSYHNYLRITRILKSLGELGFEQFKKPFLEFMLKECYETKHLPNISDSCRNYWIGTVKDDDDRKNLAELVNKYEGISDDADSSTSEDDDGDSFTSDPFSANDSQQTEKYEQSLENMDTDDAVDCQSFNEPNHGDQEPVFKENEVSKNDGHHEESEKLPSTSTNTNHMDSCQNDMDENNTFQNNLYDENLT